MSREAMTDAMRRDRRINTRIDEALSDNFLDAASAKPSASQIGNDRRIGIGGDRKQRAPSLERIEGGFTDRHHAILGAFTGSHSQHSDLIIDIAPIEADQLAHAQP